MLCSFSAMTVRSRIPKVNFYRLSTCRISGLVQTRRRARGRRWYGERGRDPGKYRSQRTYRWEKRRAAVCQLKCNTPHSECFTFSTHGPSSPPKPTAAVAEKRPQVDLICAIVPPLLPCSAQLCLCDLTATRHSNTLAESLELENNKNTQMRTFFILHLSFFFFCLEDKCLMQGDIQVRSVYTSCIYK